MMVEIEGLKSDQGRVDFVVESGTVCFGHIHNALSGLQAEPMNYRGVPAVATGGTVLQRFISFRAPVLDGVWQARAMRERGMAPQGYWVSHESVSENDLAEFSSRLDKRSPPFETGGHDTVESDGIYGVHRYDWDYYIDDGKELFTGDADCDELMGYYEGPTCVFVDSEGFQSAQQAFINYAPKPKAYFSAFKDGEKTFGTIMRAPGEYMLGRFILDDARERARAFVFYHYYFPESFVEALDSLQ